MSIPASSKIPADIAALLEEETARINSTEFIAADPVQFPRRFSDIKDIEIVALLSAMIAWGNRKMICRDAGRLLEIMNNEPYLFLKEGAYERLEDDRNIHRTFFARHLKYFMRGMNDIYKRYDSLDALAAEKNVSDDEFPAWKLVAEIQKYMSAANDGTTCSQCFPVNLEATALKRINMALRWLVRDDGIVDLGVWKSIPKSKLYIPLDVHVGNISRSLGLLNRKSNDRKAVTELTETLRTLDPEDPTKYDFALFGIGVMGKDVLL